MFLNAVLPIKIVMVGLALASLATWTVMLAKIIELWTAKRSARRGLEILAHATSLHEAEKEFGQAKSPLGRLVADAVGEADRSEGLAAEGIKDRAATLLSCLSTKARAPA
jgi:biopolymer transport protein ExbB